MSYAKAMKHAHNVRKCRKQGKMHFGFNCSDTPWPSGWGNPSIRPLLEIQTWFPMRNDGDAAKRQHNRECIREAIMEARKTKE